MKFLSRPGRQPSGHRGYEPAALSLLPLLARRCKCRLLLHVSCNKAEAVKSKTKGDKRGDCSFSGYILAARNEAKYFLLAGTCEA